MLVGRASERDRIAALLDGARSGRSGIVVLRGDAGIGKSELLAEARRQARGMRVLSVHGAEGESELAFAGLTELLVEVVDDLDLLPPPQAEALSSALARNAEPASPLAVRMALLSLLTELAERRPVLVLVDDVQWVDESSLATLAFVVRRLGADRVAVVAAVRGDAPVELTRDPRAHVDLAPLADDEAHDLLAARPELEAEEAAVLVRAAAGNPLALLELSPATGRLDQGAVAPPEPGPRVRDMFRDRLDALVPATRLAVGTVAADASATPVEMLDALARLGLSAADLVPAERGGLVTLGPDRARVRHPLMRSVAYHDLAPPDRRRVHGALAASVSSTSFERATWHRAAATVGVDEDVARALDQVAADAERRGAPEGQARALDRAASVSAPGEATAQRLLAGGDAWLAAGRWDRALDRLERGSAQVSDPGVRADVAATVGQVEAYRGGPAMGAAVLEAAAEDIEASDPARATRLFTYAVNTCVFAADAERATALARRAVECGERAGGVHPISGAMARVEAGLLAGDPSVADTLERLGALAESLIDGDLRDGEHVFGLVLMADLFRESWDRAERLAGIMVERARSTGRLFLLSYALAARAELDWRRGRWSAAYLTASTEVWETPLDFPGVGSWLHAVQARIEAGLGLHEDAERHGLAARETAAANGTHAMEAWAEASLGFLALGRARPQAAVAHLEEVEAIMARGGVREPGLLWWSADLVEARWRTGDLGGARRAAQVLTEGAEATGLAWPEAAARRSRGLLASSAEDTEEAFAAAHAWHGRLDAPFEAARTLLLQGERRRSDGRADPEGPLRKALATFERLRAEPWADQARRLLGDEASGLVVAPLTRQERQVASIVGMGATNREAADQLYVSPRTIDFHLRNIYKKLGIRSRTELAVHVATEEV